MGLKPSAAVTGTGFGQGLTVACDRWLRGAHPWGPHACVRSARARRSRAAPFNPGFFFLLIELQKWRGAGAVCSHPLLKEQAAPGPHQHTGEAAPCSRPRGEEGGMLRKHRATSLVTSCWGQAAETG